MLLHSHFPISLHDEILRATGVTTESSNISYLVVEEPPAEFDIYSRLKRPGGFREAVLAAYENQCAVCSFAVKLEGRPLALEAAHIKWHGASGPAEVSNGLSLCALHHKLFDKGAFTLRPGEHKILVADTISSSDPGFEDTLGKFNEKHLNSIPHEFKERPAPEFIEWHNIQVFKSPALLRGAY